MSKITDLIQDALMEDDYKLRINFIVAGLISAESNDTEEKISANKKYLCDIKNYIKDINDPDKKEFLDKIEKRIDEYLISF